jgi:hypothetical protein
VYTGKWRITHVIGRIVIADGTVEPLTAIRVEAVTRLHSYVMRDIWMPAVVANMLLISE